jgi:hypothetical protein
MRYIPSVLSDMQICRIRVVIDSSIHTWGVTFRTTRGSSPKIEEAVAAPHIPRHRADFIPLVSGSDV